jgi:putative transposase
MISLVRIVVALVSDAVRLVWLLFRPSAQIRAENLVLRKQLAQYIERGFKPRCVDAARRASLALLTRWFDWHDAIVIVRPRTILHWYRADWRWKCKSGRPPIPAELRCLIRRMGAENPLWGEERIASELLVKLGIGVSPRTVRVGTAHPYRQRRDSGSGH